MESSLRQWYAGTTNRLERFCAAATVAFTLWIASDWLFALTHTLTRGVLIARTILFLLLALFVCLRTRPRVRVNAIDAALLVPLALWLAFILWRGAVIPPVTHDALSHHLPRAVVFERAHGFVDASRISPVFDDIPVNYELLLADVIALTGSDDYTEWLCTLLFGVFVLASGALAQRWWGNRTVTLAVMAVVAGAPVLLLHSGTHKNDLLAGTFMLLALLWAGRFFATRETSSLLLLTSSLMIAAGTKPQGALLGIALAPLVLWRARVRQLVPAIAIVLAGVFLLGGYTYVDNYLVRAPAAASAPSAPYVPHYGDWANFWQAPWVLAAAPFSRSASTLWVPWDRPWFWKPHEIYFSHFGVLFSLCLLGAPFVWRRNNERFAVAAAALATVLMMLPVYFQPHGAFAISLPRYIFFFLPVVVAWTLGGLATRVSPQLLLAIGVAFFCYYAIDTAINDTFAPLSYVLKARHFPNTRVVPFDPYRATEQFDRMAGPDDRVAVDATWGTWVHPLFGRRLTRPVFFIPQTGGPPLIPGDAQWVVVERAYAVIWGSPRMKSVADAWAMFDTNRPSPAQTRVTDYLKRDPSWKLIGEDRKRNQAIFRRVSSRAQ